jgi:hypothetical protein
MQEQLQQGQPEQPTKQEPPLSQSSHRSLQKEGATRQPMRGRGNRQGGEDKAGRRKEGPIQQQVQPQPLSAVEEQQLLEEEQRK